MPCASPDLLRATAHAADPWSVPGVGGYRIEEFFFPMAILAYIDRHITYIIGIYILASAQIITECIVIRSLESIKNNNSIAREMPLQLAKPLANVPWRHSSEALERQHSSPRHAKHKPEKLCERYLYQWQMSLGGTVPKHSNTSRIRAQGMQNTSQKNSPNVTFGIHRKQQFYRP